MALKFLNNFYYFENFVMPIIFFQKTIDIYFLFDTI